MTLNIPLPLETRLVERVWGGQRLGGSADSPIGEAWVIHEDNRVSSGPHAGRTLAELTAEHAADLLGTRGEGTRFPLLVKLLDCADWLSVQVHPDDAQAAELEGPGHLGKTEAWHILAAEPGARIISGVQESTDAAQLDADIRAGRVMDHVTYADVQAGDTFLIPAGTVHALGPGILLYEVQQSSDLTYRIYDWDRPATAGRALHLEQSAQVSRPVSAAAQPPSGDGTLTRSPYFVLERLEGTGQPLHADTAGETFHLLTVTRGQAQVQAGSEAHDLGEFDSLLIPASVGAYTVSGEFTGLRSALP